MKYPKRMRVDYACHQCGEAVPINRIHCDEHECMKPDTFVHGETMEMALERLRFACERLPTPGRGVLGGCWTEPVTRSMTTTWRLSGVK